MIADRRGSLKNPALFQVHALAFLRRLEEKYKKPLTLASIPQAEWDKLADQGFRLFWAMGVWERSPESRRSALGIPQLKEAFTRVLPGWTEADVAGSPYSVKSYSLDGRLGKKGDLAKLRKKVNKAGLGLVLDFVPNHMATDHAWIDIPDRLIRGTEEDLKKDPSLFFKGGKKGLVTAHGKDPYFPGWQDTAQVYIFSKETREALTDKLLKVAGCCDGVRCDMTMLLLNDVFKKTWANYLGNFPEPAEEYWPAAIERIKNKYPNFIFIAEVYWGLEKKLQGLGFDFTYDKQIYDLLRWKTAPEVRDCLKNDLSYQERSVRFVENHDEERAVTAFGRERSFAAAAVIATLPGMHFFHDGQAEGKKLHFPIQLGRAAPEPVDRGTVEFYKKLFRFTRSIDFTDARWVMPEILPASAGDETWRNLLCWGWMKNTRKNLAVINYSSVVSRGKIRWPGNSKIGIVSDLKPWEVILV